MKGKQIYILLFAVFLLSCKQENKWVFVHEILLGEVVPFGLVVKNESLWVSDVKGNRLYEK